MESDDHKQLIHLGFLDHDLGLRGTPIVLCFPDLSFGLTQLSLERLSVHCCDDLAFVDRIPFVGGDFLIRPGYFVAMFTCLASSRPLTPAKPGGKAGFESISHAPAPTAGARATIAIKITFLDIAMVPSRSSR